MGADTYRSRIYNQYVRARDQPLAPAAVAGLAPRAPYLRRLVRQHFPPDKHAAILDVGCGHGALIHFARELGYCNVRGVDASFEQVAAARRLGIDGVVAADLRDLLQAQSDASLDLVVAFDVIEHFTREELLPFVDRVHRVLKPGARWLIHAPNGESPFCSSVRYGDLTHEVAFTRASLTQLLLCSRFRDVAFYEDTPAIHGPKSAIRWILWQTFRGVLCLHTLAETGVTGASHIFSRSMLAVATK